MATAGAVLGVIRASRPILQNAIERVAFAVHSAFLAAGYSIVAVGAAADVASANGAMKEPEVGVEGWNSLEGAYAFRYSGAGEPGLCKSVTLKLVVMADSLMVDVAPADTDTLHHLEIRATDYAKDSSEAGNYAQQFTNLDGLIKHINDTLLAKLSPTRMTTVAASASSTPLVGQGESQGDNTRCTSAPPLLFDTRHSFINPGFGFPPGFIGGSNDVFPRPGGGICAPRRDFGSDGILIGPNDIRWGHPSGHGSQPGITPDFGEQSVPPGARYDPVGPPSVPDVDTIDYNRSTHRLLGRHPDLEHF